MFFSTEKESIINEEGGGRLMVFLAGGFSP